MFRVAVQHCGARHACKGYMHRTLLTMLLLRSTAALRAGTVRAGRRGVARAARKTKEEDAAAAAPVINWYPGHIARAERELRGYLKRGRGRRGARREDRKEHGAP